MRGFRRLYATPSPRLSGVREFFSSDKIVPPSEPSAFLSEMSAVESVGPDVMVNQDGTTDYTVTFAPAPSCVSVKPVVLGDFGVPSVCASSIGAVCFWTVWDIRAVVNDTKTGASVVLHHGVKTIAGLNAAVTSCGL